ncbi:MAG: hypothetical protein GY714_04730 [Desulfobacterales bacterium]|nr:hypothetical protein [Desulfobacterales bacterium]
MKFSIRQNTIPKDIYKQLGFSDYLKLFDFSPNNLGFEILDPLDKSEGLGHFQNLSYLNSQIEKSGSKVLDLIEMCKTIPKLEGLIHRFEDENLDQYHLFELGHFIEIHKKLFGMEIQFPVDNKFEATCLKMEDILCQYTKNSYREIKYNPVEEELRGQIRELEDHFRNGVVKLEKRVFIETKLKFIYPYPKEIPIDTDLRTFGRSKDISVKKTADAYIVNIVPGTELNNILNEKKCLIKSLEKEMEKKLILLNNSLSPYFEEFKRYISKRNFRIFQYVLLGASLKHNLCFPEFTDQNGIKVENGRLHQLEKLKNNKMVPLDITLKNGASVLSGANMSGKTTVLKTLYFLMILIKFGLPVPAKKVVLNYPSDIDLNLKSSGDIKTGTSGFSEELIFLTKERKNGSFILCDELFMTTDPLNGAKLSKIFLDEFKNKDFTLLVSSHYTEISEVNGIGLFKMKDSEFNKEKLNLSDLMESTPYIVEAIKSGEQVSDANKKPFEIALHFPLTDNIRAKISEELKKGS